MKKYFMKVGPLVAIGMACLFFFSACSQEKTLATGEPHTVEWFKEHNAERRAVLEECSNNPGEMADLPNCQNAETAELKLSVGTNGPIKW
jgi:hypothetical protein